MPPRAPKVKRQVAGDAAEHVAEHGFGFLGSRIFLINPRVRDLRGRKRRSWRAGYFAQRVIEVDKPWPGQDPLRRDVIEATAHDAEDGLLARSLGRQCHVPALAFERHEHVVERDERARAKTRSGTENTDRSARDGGARSNLQAVARARGEE